MSEFTTVVAGQEMPIPVEVKTPGLDNLASLFVHHMNRRLPGLKARLSEKAFTEAMAEVLKMKDAEDWNAATITQQRAWIIARLRKFAALAGQQDQR